MDTITVDGKFLKSLTHAELSKWLQVHRLDLAGASVFTKSSGWLSPTIEFLTRKDCKDTSFIPSHVGSILLLGSILYCFDMKPPKATITNLFDYIVTTNDTFKIVMILDSKIEIAQFSYDLFCKVDEKYGYLSALQCIKGLRWILNRKHHCSELATLEYQKFGYLTDLKADDTTPALLYSKMCF